MSFILTPRQASDIGQAENLLALTPEGVGALLADQGYDGNTFIQSLGEKALSQLSLHEAIETARPLRLTGV